MEQTRRPLDGAREPFFVSIKDTSLIFASPPGNLAFTKMRTISDFVKIFCEVLERHSTSEDYQTMTERTAELLHAEPEFHFPSDDPELEGFYKMCSYVETTLCRKVFFYPPTQLYSGNSFLEKYGSLFVRFESVNYPNFFIRHRCFECWLDKFGACGGEALFKLDSSFKVIEGLSNCGVSFQSQNYPEYYLTQKDGLIRIENASNPNLKKDATWRMVGGLWPDNKGDTYSLSYPTAPSKFIRHQGYRLKMHENDKSELFLKDSSFNIRIVR